MRAGRRDDKDSAPDSRLPAGQTQTSGRVHVGSFILPRKTDDGKLSTGSRRAFDRGTCAARSLPDLGDSQMLGSFGGTFDDPNWFDRPAAGFVIFLQGRLSTASSPPLASASLQGLRYWLDATPNSPTVLATSAVSRHSTDGRLNGSAFGLSRSNHLKRSFSEVMQHARCRHNSDRDTLRWRSVIDEQRHRNACRDVNMAELPVGRSTKL